MCSLAYVPNSFLKLLTAAAVGDEASRAQEASWELLTSGCLLGLLPAPLTNRFTISLCAKQKHTQAQRHREQSQSNGKRHYHRITKTLQQISHHCFAETTSQLLFTLSCELSQGKVSKEERMQVVHIIRSSWLRVRATRDTTVFHSFAWHRRTRVG